LLSVFLVFLKIFSRPRKYIFEITNTYDKDLVELQKKIIYNNKNYLYFKLIRDIELPNDTSLIKTLLLHTIKTKFKNGRDLVLLNFHYKMNLKMPNSEVGETSFFYYTFLYKRKKYETFAVIYHNLNKRIVEVLVHRYYDRD
jgi:hypothetical protein